MGNANGREEGESGSDDLSVRSGIDNEGSTGRSGGVGSVGPISNATPPGSPGRSRSPTPLSRQVPSAPLMRPPNVSPGLNHLWMDSPDELLNFPAEKGNPTFITWSYGGTDVSVEGSWDNWCSRRPLVKSGKDHILLLVLSSGTYHYRFVVDGEWRYISDLPHVADEKGHVANLLHVTRRIHPARLGSEDYIPENLESISELEAPSSPDSSYSRSFPVEEDFTKEPPVVPHQAHLSILQNESDDESLVKPQHVVLNHLFIEKGWASQSLVALGLTQRFQSKYVTVVLYKPLRR